MVWIQVWQGYGVKEEAEAKVKAGRNRPEVQANVRTGAEAEARGLRSAIGGHVVRWSSGRVLKTPELASVARQRNHVPSRLRRGPGCA